MKSVNITLTKVEADEGKCFDWAIPHTTIDEDGNEVVEHLYSRVLFLAVNDDLSNYIEVDIPTE